MTDLDLRSMRFGQVIAPAGCGKTHLIASTLKKHTSGKPILVLTHTNAGVSALRVKLRSDSISKKCYRIMTIDGFAMRMVKYFPRRANYAFTNADRYIHYPRIRTAMCNLISDGNLNNELAANYSCLLVDEYQDCNQVQHNIIIAMSQVIPTCVLGDPLQGIFNFGNNTLVDWNKQVNTKFREKVTLDTPWRWKNVSNDALGEWLLSIRDPLSDGRRIDLRQAPETVRWYANSSNPNDKRKIAIKAAYCGHRRRDESVLVIGDSQAAGSRHNLARMVKGLEVVEPVDMKDLSAFAASVDLSSKRLVRNVLNFTSALMTGLDVNKTVKRLHSLQSVTARKPASTVESTVLKLDEQRSYLAIKELLSAYCRDQSCRVFRSSLLECTLHCLSLCSTNDELSLEEAYVRVREAQRVTVRRLRHSSIGSTLLLKGLEADHVVLVDADSLSAKNLYVALTRGSRTVTVVSNDHYLG